MENEVVKSITRVLNYPLFSIKETPISLSSLIIMTLIIILFVVIAKFFKSRLLKRILHKFKIDEGIQFTLLRISQYLIIFSGVIIAFQTIGVDLTGLAVVLGFLSVGIGFGLQNVTSNFIAGLILLFERPIKVGDRVTVGDREGDIENINIRATTIRSIRNISIIVPNSEFISNNVINWSFNDKIVGVDIDVGVSYNSDIDVVFKALKEAAEENEHVLKTPEPEIFFLEFGDSSWNMRLRVWIDTPSRHQKIKSDVNVSIVHIFRKYNIEIPFPQRDVNFRNAIEIKQIEK